MTDSNVMISGQAASTDRIATVMVNTGTGTLKRVHFNGVATAAGAMLGACAAGAQQKYLVVPFVCVLLLLFIHGVRVQGKECPGSTPRACNEYLLVCASSFDIV